MRKRFLDNLQHVTKRVKEYKEQNVDQIMKTARAYRDKQKKSESLQKADGFNIKNMKDKIMNSTVDVKDKIMNNTADMKDKIMNNTSDVKDKIMNSTVDAKNKIMNNTSDVKDKIMNNTAEAKNKLNQYLKDRQQNNQHPKENTSRSFPYNLLQHNFQKNIFKPSQPIKNPKSQSIQNQKQSNNKQKIQKMKEQSKKWLDVKVNTIKDKVQSGTQSMIKIVSKKDKVDDKSNDFRKYFTSFGKLLSSYNVPKLQYLNSGFKKIYWRLLFLIMIGCLTYGIGSSIPRELRIYLSDKKNNVSQSKGALKQ